MNFKKSFNEIEIEIINKQILQSKNGILSDSINHYFLKSDLLISKSSFFNFPEDLLVWEEKSFNIQAENYCSSIEK